MCAGRAVSVYAVSPIARSALTTQSFPSDRNVRYLQALGTSAQTFRFPCETYPLREFLGVLRRGRDASNKAHTKPVLVKCVRTSGDVAMSGQIRNNAYHFGEPVEESLVRHSLFASYGRRIFCNVRSPNGFTGCRPEVHWSVLI